MDKITCEQLGKAMYNYCIVMFSVSGSNWSEESKELKELRWHPLDNSFSVCVIKPSPFISNVTEGITTMTQAVELYNATIIK